MAGLGYSAAVDGSVVRISAGGAPVGAGRFLGTRIIDYEGEALGETPEAHAAALSDLAERLLAQAREELAAMQREAYDEDGVDESLIRWMLSLTPFERLRTLDAQNRFVSLGRAAYRNKGFFVPEEVK